MKTKTLKLKSYCAMDLHYTHTVFDAQTPRGAIRLHRDIPTERIYIIEALKSVPGPRGVVIEEGPMADWAMRVVKPYVAEVIVCDPRRNHLICKDGDKTDHVDPVKLNELYRLGALRRVHHPERQSTMDLRGWVWSYYDQADLVVAAKNKTKALFRMAGVQYGTNNIYTPRHREKWLNELRRRSARERMELLYGNLDDLQTRQEQIHKRLCRIARRHPVTKRFLQIPGYAELRALTFMVMIDTPFRFPTPQKLWRYSGLGLRRVQSGDPNSGRQHPPMQYNRRLKNIARGAMETVLNMKDDNPFKKVYRRLLAQGLKESLARLTVARKTLVVPWGMWKGGTEYDPALVTKY